MKLDYFNNIGFYDALKTFFEKLNVPINYVTEAPTSLAEVLETNYKLENEAHKMLQDVYFLGMVDDKAFKKEKSAVNLNNIKASSTDYDGLLIFGVELINDKKLPSRSQLAEITRAFNREFNYTPVVVVFKYQNFISFANCERVEYKQKWREGEKIGKFSILKDIDIVTPHTGHIKILQNLEIPRSGKNNVNSFDELYKYWQSVFNISILNKNFYNELFNWYLWANTQVKFPQERPAEDKILDNIHQSESLIRLLTRLLFCWFMKEKGLISNDLFDEKYLSGVLNEFGKDYEKTIYYKAILQNLFFATLNKPIEQRKIINDVYPSKEYGDPLVYRYKELFINPDKLLSYFEKIPFLNGGLFECLDQKKDANNPIEIRLDGFSTKTHKQPLVPDKLFFGEYNIDLSKDYEDKKNTDIRVHGLIDILNSYKFTIEENTPIDEEIALDPELLGKIFESLLASYNPETKITARKQTGSFYTPREIVNYMVDESLIAYLKNKLTLDNSVENLEKDLRKLFSYTDEQPFVKAEEIKNLLNSIDECKILDPACGSGAFPMGVLHKMIHLLKKLDPKNEIWLDMVVKKFPASLQEKMRKKLKKEDLNYVRKLGIIQDGIYGIDIQPIAIQISKLRFFISLLVDQKGDSDLHNQGFEALPNLDFKLICANTLINPPKSDIDKMSIGLFENQKDPFFEKLEELSTNYFSMHNPEDKESCKKEITKLIDSKCNEEIKKIESKYASDNKLVVKTLKEKNKDYIAEKESEVKLWKSYNNLFKHETVGFFDIKYFFPKAQDGFDIVIGNPPYLQIQSFSGKKEQKDWEAQKYETFSKTGDIYSLFYEKGNMVLKEKGLLCFITSNKWMRAGYGENTRKYFAEKTNPLLLIDFGGYKVFESATVDTNILIFQKDKNLNKTIGCSVQNVETFYKTSLQEYIEKNTIVLDNLSSDSWIILSKKEFDIKKKIESVGIPLKDWDININRGILTGFNEAFIIDGKKKDELIKADPKNAEIIKPILRGRDIKKYRAEFADLWLINSHNGLKSKNIKPIDVIKNYPIIYEHLKTYQLQLEKRLDKGEHWSNLRNCAYLDEFEKEKIIYPDIAEKLTFSFDKKKIFMNNTCYFLNFYKNNLFIISILNSSLMNWYFSNLSAQLGEKTVRHFNIYIEKLPIPKISSEDQKPFEILVDLIIFAKENGFESESKTFEAVIDGLVYDLYFPEEMKKGSCYITDRIKEKVKPFEPNDTNEFKKEYIQALDKFCNTDKIIYGALIYRRNIDIVKIITNKDDSL